MADQGRGGLLSPWLRRKRFAAAAPFVRGRVLDVGCGVGALLSVISAEAYVGVDRDEAALEIARAGNPAHVFTSSLPESGSFDTLVALAVVEHFKDPEKELRSWRGLLAPGGRVVLTTPSPLADRIHALGAAVGLFSREAHEEHETLFDGPKMRDLAARCGFAVIAERHFLLRLNQLFVLEPIA